MAADRTVFGNKLLKRRCDGGGESSNYRVQLLPTIVLVDTQVYLLFQIERGGDDAGRSLFFFSKVRSFSCFLAQIYQLYNVLFQPLICCTSLQNIAMLESEVFYPACNNLRLAKGNHQNKLKIAPVELFGKSIKV